MAKPSRSDDDRPKSRDVGALAAIWPFLRPYRLMMVGAGLALILTSGINLILPLAVRRVVDGFNSGTEMLDKYFVAALVIVALLAVGTGLRYWMVTWLGERIVADMRRAVFDRVISLSPSFYERVMTGEIISRITTDTTLIQSVVGSSVSVALRNALVLLGGFAMLVLTSGKLTGFVLLLIPLVLVPIIVLGRRLRALSRKNQDLIADSSGAASEALLSATTIQAFTQEAPTRKRFADLTEAGFQAAMTRIKTRAIMTMIVIFLIFSGVTSILWLGARDVQTGTMSIGELVQFVIYAIFVAGSAGALSEVWGEIQRAAGAAERLAELLSARDTLTDPEKPAVLTHPVRGAISFEDVTLHYPTRPDMAALSHFDLHIKPGETVALVGPSGAGKTTVIELILRFWDPETGRVTLDGVDLRDLSRSDFRRAIALVPQDPVIFSGTVAENIMFGRPDATQEELVAAAVAANADGFIEKLPGGYDASLGERGVMLSGGQRQRIAIARAILRDAPVMLLDEATSALDSESERAVQVAVDRLAQGRTTIIVAHRLATVKKADRIIVMDNGEVISQGTHESLVAEGGLYARLAQLQFTDGGGTI